MVELNWKQIDDQYFRKGVMALNGCRDVDAKIAYRAGRVMTVCQREATKINRLKKSIADKYLYNVETNQFPNAEAQENADKEIEAALQGTKVSVKILPIEWNDIFGKVPFGGIELVAIQPICTGYPSEEEDV